METSQITLSFANVSGKKIEADFDGGTTTSDGGVLLLRQAEARTGRGIVKCCGWQESASQRFQAASFISPSMNGTPSMTWVMSL